MDDEKPKRKSGYRQNRELAIICALWLVMIFFHLDDLIGAMGLRQYYTVGSLLMIALLFATGVTLGQTWHSGFTTNKTLLVMFFLASLGCGLVIGGLYPLPIFVGWVVTVAVIWMPPQLLLGGFLASVLMLEWSIRRRLQFDPATVKVILAFILIFSVANMLFNSADNFEETTVETLFFEQHYYIVIVYWGWLGDPDSLTLYECDQFAIHCEAVFSPAPDQFRFQDITLRPSTSGDLELLVDNVLLYRYVPS